MARTKKAKEEGIEVPQSPAEAKRDALIEGLKGILLTKAQLKSGGSAIRAKHQQEQAYQADIDEINALGKELGYGPIGLGDLRG